MRCLYWLKSFSTYQPDSIRRNLVISFPFFFLSGSSMAPQIITRKGLTKPMVRFVLPMMRDISLSVGNIIRGRKLRCNDDSIKCLYELIITRYEIVNAIVDTLKKWQKRIPEMSFDVHYNDDEEPEPERVDIFIPLRTNIIHIRYTVDMLENPFELKFFVETATHTFSEPMDFTVNFKTLIRYLWMPLEAIEIATETTNA